MSTRYQPALDLVDRLLQDRLVSRIPGPRDRRLGAAPGSTDANRSAPGSAGSTGQTMRPHLEPPGGARRTARAEQVEAVYLLGMGGSSLCAEVLRSVCGRRGIAAAARARHDRRADDHAGRGPAGTRGGPGSSCRARAAARSRWHRWSGSSGRGSRPRSASAPADSSSPSPIRGPRSTPSRPRAATARRSSTRRTSAAGSRALSLFGLVPAALHRTRLPRICCRPVRRIADGCRQENATEPGPPARRVHRAPPRANGRDKLTVAPAPVARLARPVDRAAGRREHRQARHGIALPVVDERARPPRSNTARDRAFVAIAHRPRRRWTRARIAALEDAGHPVLAPQHAPRRRSAPSSSAGSSQPRSPARRWASIRSTSRTCRRPRRRPRRCSADHDASRPAHRAPPRPHRPTASTCSASRFAGDSPAQVVRAALAALTPPDYVAFLLVPAAGQRSRPGDHRDPRRNTRALPGRQHVRRRARAICTPPGSTTRADPTPRSHSS